VIGNFNEWHPTGFEMHRNDQSQPWSIQLQLPPGRYEYSFLVDGQKIIADPQAPFYQDDGFGNQNGVLIVGNSHEARSNPTRLIRFALVVWLALSLVLQAHYWPTLETLRLPYGQRSGRGCRRRA